MDRSQSLEHDWELDARTLAVRRRMELMVIDVLSNLRLFFEILLGAAAVLGIAAEVYGGHIRGTIRALRNMPQDVDDRLGEVAENQQEMMRQHRKIGERMDTVENGIEAVGMAVNQDREVDMERLQEDFDVEDRPDDLLRGNDSVPDGGWPPDGDDEG